MSTGLCGRKIPWVCPIFGLQNEPRYHTNFHVIGEPKKADRIRACAPGLAYLSVNQPEASANAMITSSIATSRRRVRRSAVQLRANPKTC